jgi:hypothetical protein
MKLRPLLTDLTNQCQIRGYDEEPGELTIFINGTMSTFGGAGLKVAVEQCEDFGGWVGTEDELAWKAKVKP